MKSKDLTGKVFGNWTVKSFAGTNSKYVKLWNVVCTCGNVRVISVYTLTYGRSTKCKECRRRPLLGKRFGALEVVGYVGSGMWRVKCDCGMEKHVDGQKLVLGKRKSCGCLKYDQTRAAVSTGTRPCSKCGKVKALEEFNTNSRIRANCRS
mgnify:CR=1 FL=1